MDDAGSERSRLNSLGSYDILDSAPEPSFDSITHFAAQMFDAPIALVTFIDEQRCWPKARLGLGLAEWPRRLSFCDHVIGGPDVLVVPDASRDPRFANLPLVKEDPGIRFYAGAPLRTQDGLGLGMVCVMDKTPRPGVSSEAQAGLKMLAAL